MGDRYERRGDYAARDDGYHDGYGQDADDDGLYEDEAGGAYGAPDAYGYDGNDVRQAPMRSFGVDRADYYSDSHAPLISQSDVRSQPLSVVPVPGQSRDAIPPPRVYQRPREGFVRPAQTAATGGEGRAGRVPYPERPERPERPEDLYAFKDGLARQQGSFAQLQSERLRMEDTGRLASPGTVHRRLEHIRPMTYADAEQVAQALKGGIIVVLDLRTTRPELAKRILDFSFGAASALDGQVERHVDRVYVFTRSAPLSEGERAAIRL
jgi:cell division inhibitor SepF